MRTSALALALLFLSACAPANDKPKTDAPATKPAVAAPTQPATPPPAATDGAKADPRIPTVDPTSITDASTVAQVMHAFVIPGSETLFAAENEETPTTEAGWARLKKATDDIIHGCELLKAPSRSKGEGWNKTSDTVIAATKTTAANLAKKSTEDLVFTDGDMMAGCTACHRDYRDQKPPVGHLIEKQPT